MSICLAITDVDWALTKDVFAIIGTLVSAAGVGLAFYVGLKGLATWSRQLKGTSDHELSRKALIELYRYREAVERARSPVMFGYESDLTPEEANGLNFSEQRHLGRRKGYHGRFDRISKTREPIHITLLDAEAIWGKELGELFKPLFVLQSEFHTYVEYDLMATDPQQDEDSRRSYYGVIKDRRKVMYDKTDDIGDEFRQEFNAASLAIENYLRPKLIK